MDRHTQQAMARFDDWSITYDQDRISSWLRFYQSLAMSELNISAGKRFLDVGCGTGWAVREAASRLTSDIAYGIDISPGMIEKAVAQSASIQNVEFQIADAEAIPYPDEYFSLILCTCSFHHYQNPMGALLQMKRVMKKGGRLVILDSARDVSFAIWLQDRWRRYLERSHVQYYTTTEMEQLLAESKWSLVNKTTIRKFMDRKKLFTGLMLLECVK